MANLRVAHHHTTHTQYAAYGLDSDAVPRAVIQEFFGYWWPTPLKDKARTRVNFVDYQGSLNSRAVAVVSTTGKRGERGDGGVGAGRGANVFAPAA
jgi:hypothetical protein